MMMMTMGIKMMILLIMVMRMMVMISGRPSKRGTQDANDISDAYEDKNEDFDDDGVPS